MFSLSELPVLVYFYFLFFVAVLGLCIGSFSNVVILRGLSGESIVLPPSKCPKCSHQLKWYDNIPLLSYLFLRGKCRYCKTNISIQYPVVEFLVSALFVFVFLKYEFSLNTIFLWAIVTLFVILSATDFKEQVILTPHAYVLTAIGIIYNFYNRHFLLPFLGIIAGFMVMEALARLGEQIFSKRAFGEGDSYIGAAIGAIIGWKMFLYSLVLAIIIQAVVVIPLYLFRLLKEKKYKLFTSLFAFLAISIFLYFYKSINFYLYILFALVLCVLAIVIIKQIFNSAKQENLYQVPFGPAMLVSAFLFIFFLKNLSVFNI